jgi:hypothetical protein
MPDRSSKNPLDIVQLAAHIVEQATGKTTPHSSVDKNPAAVALGRLGGLKGGKARADKLSSKRKKEIARKAALARWNKKA